MFFACCLGEGTYVCARYSLLFFSGWCAWTLAAFLALLLLWQAIFDSHPMSASSWGPLFALIATLVFMLVLVLILMLRLMPVLMVLMEIAPLSPVYPCGGGGCRTGPRCHASGESTISLVFSASNSFALCVVAKPLLVLGFVFASCAGTTEQQRLQEELEELSKAKARERDNGSRRGSGSWDAHGDGGWAGTLNLFCLLLAAAEAATGLQN